VLRVIRGPARLGFALDEISELIEVGAHRGTASRPVRRCGPKPTEVEAKIAALWRVRAALSAELGPLVG
jgi:hypothetical protein